MLAYQCVFLQSLPKGRKVDILVGQQHKIAILLKVRKIAISDGNLPHYDPKKIKIHTKN